ncbi:hypothetical protein KQI84_05625 [bacterium]|nr:hypothetical protein [bacterium]
MFDDLVQYYEILTRLQGWTGLIAKVCLASILAAIAGGNRRPGQQLLSVVFGVLFFRIFLSLFIRNEQGAFNVSPAMLPMAVPAFVLALVFAITVFKPEGEWVVLHPVPWRRWLGFLLLAWAFYFPVHSDSELGAILFSPMGVIPGPALLAAGTVAWLSIPNTPRLAGWALALALIYYGIMEMVAGIGSSAVMLLLGLGLGGELIFNTMKAGGILEDDVPPVDRKTRRPTREQKEKGKEQRTWKLK